jgi:hypothetical protein
MYRRDTMDTNTWKGMSESLGDISPEAKEILRKATAALRERQRVKAAFEAAQNWSRENLPGGKTFAEFYAACLCWLESRGLYGGGPHCPGAGTRRHPAFRSLGSGRRHARDGHVWTTAIAAAATSWLANLPGPHTLEFGVMDEEDLAVFLYWEGRTVQFVDLPLLLGSEPEAMLNAALHAARDVYHDPELWGKLAPAIGKTIDLARQLLANWK